MSPLYGAARLAVAPLRFGAGLKGKALEAWAAGIPCAMTPIAAEGLPLPGELAETVAADAAALAERLGRAGRAVLRTGFSRTAEQAALAAAISAPAQPAASVQPLLAVRPG